MTVLGGAHADAFSQESRPDLKSPGEVINCSSSDDAMVTAIHHKKLSLALRRHQTGRRMSPISFACGDIPQFYQCGPLLGADEAKDATLPKVEKAEKF
jgi:hypothetical protein